MYAIIETSGKRYRVEKSDIIDIELLKDTESGKISFEPPPFTSDEFVIKVDTP